MSDTVALVNEDTLMVRREGAFIGACSSRAQVDRLGAAMGARGDDVVRIGDLVDVRRYGFVLGVVTLSPASLVFHGAFNEPWDATEFARAIGGEIRLVRAPQGDQSDTRVIVMDDWVRIDPTEPLKDSDITW